MSFDFLFQAAEFSVYLHLAVELFFRMKTAFALRYLPLRSSIRPILSDINGLRPGYVD